MPTIKTYDGTEHEVTAPWYDECVIARPHLAEMNAEQHATKLRQLLAASNSRPLSETEEQEVRALDKWTNINRAWSWLAGRHYSEIGFGCLDQVHGNRTTHGCGCQTQHIFDHYKTGTDETHEHHAHFSRKSCRKHAHLMVDFNAHHAAVIADNK